MKLPLFVELWLERVKGRSGGLREWMQGNQTIVAGAAGVLLLICLIAIIMQIAPTGSSVKTPNSAYFYDVVTGKVFQAPFDAVPPITSPDGNEAVRAHFYSCGDCNESDRFVGYYEKYTPQAKEVVEKARTSADPNQAMPYEPMGDGLLISFDAKTWFAMYSPKAEQGMGERLNCPGGQRLRYCQAK